MEPAIQPEHPIPVKARPWYRDWLLLPLIGIVFGVDQLTKYLVRAHLQMGESFPGEGIFRITLTFNTGSAFGLFPNQTLFLIVASFIAIVILLILYRNHPFPGPLLRLSLGLQLGGALGNLVDRLRLGYVTDFIGLGFWPVFNLADASIVVGIVILVWLFLFPRRARQEVPVAPEAGSPPEAPPGDVE
jgi:signal peptidase II